MKRSSSDGFRRIAVIVSKVTLVTLWIGILVICLRCKDEFTVEEILRYTPDNPWRAAAMLLGLFGLKSLSIVFPSGVLYAASGVMFPLWAALTVNVLGSVIMLSLPYVIGRYAGSSAAAYIYEKYPKAAAVHELRSNNDFAFALLIRLIGILPLDVVSLYMGATDVRYGKYLAGSLLGILPSIVTYPIMGMAITDPGSPQFLISLCIQVVFRAASVGGYAIYRRRNPSARRNSAGKDSNTQ